MANHVYNTLRISDRGTHQSTQDLDTLSEMFLNACEIEDYDLAMQLYPLNDEKEWRYFEATELWGSKWLEVEDSYSYCDYINVQFTSAWTPPIGVLLAICNKFDVNVTCRFEEDANSFFGHFSNATGDTLAFWFDFEGAATSESLSFEEWDTSAKERLHKVLLHKRSMEAA